jgi:hypothetical protein
MAKLRDIISSNELAILKLSNTDDEIIAIAKARYKEQKAQKQTIQNKIKENTTSKEENFKNSIYMDDGVVGSALRGMTTVANRTVAGADYLAEKVGFDLVSDEVTNNMNTMNEMMETKKQTTSRKDLSKERLSELQKLDTQSQNANGVWENVKAGANTMVDTVTHPKEWTTQGIVEMITDPLNAVSFGAGSIAGKVGRTLLQKGMIGATAGTVEGVTVNSGAEYIIAKGQNKSDDEANKIALQSAGGGAVAGGTFSTFGGIVSKSSHPIKLEKSETSDILDNELLKTNNMKPLTPEQVNAKLHEAMGNYPKVSEEFKSETAGVNKYSIHPEDKGKPNFQLVYDNLPVVRATMEKLPVVYRELVEVEILTPEQVMQLEAKHKKMITHKDVIYADYDGWAENVGQDIIDAINQKKIYDMKQAQDISTKAVEQSKIISQDLISQGADAVTIKDEINKQLIPTKQELELTNTINDGIPVENRFSGTRLRDIAKNSIDAGMDNPQDMATTLKKGGVSDELTNVVVSSIINKNIDTLDNFVVEKTTQNIEATHKALKETITKDIKDANIENQRTDREDISTSRENGDNESDNTSTSDTITKQEQDRQETSTNNGSTIPETTKRNDKSNNSDDGLSDGTKPMERHETTTDNDGDNAELGRDKVVSKQDGDSAKLTKKEKKEKKNIYNVTFNDKLKTSIQKSNLDDVIQYEKGNRKYGAKHIIRKHYGDGKVGELTKQDILEFGNIVRNGDINPKSFRETNQGISYVYELKNDKNILSVVVEETNDGTKILSGFSNKNLSDWIKKDDGTTLGQPSSVIDSIANKDIQSQEVDFKNTFTKFTQHISTKEHKELKTNMDNIHKKITMEKFDKTIKKLSKGC